MTTMMKNTQAYQKGYNAYWNRIFKTSNPFDSYDQLIAWREWNDGWDMAEASDIADIVN